MEEKKNKILRGQIPTSVFYILFGLCLALMPVETVNVLCKVVFGMILIGAGLYHIFIFVREKENSTILDLFSGVIVLVIGVFLFMNPQVVIKLLTLMLGAFILVDSIWMLSGSRKLRKRKQSVWKGFLAISLVFIGLGILILVNPFSEIKMTVQVSGGIFVANGILDLIFYGILRHGLKKEIPEETQDQLKEQGMSGTEAAQAPEGWQMERKAQPVEEEEVLESWENSEFAAPGQNGVQEGNYEVASEAYQEENPSGAAGQDYRKGTSENAADIYQEVPENDADSQGAKISLEKSRQEAGNLPETASPEYASPEYASQEGSSQEGSSQEEASQPENGEVEEVLEEWTD